MARQGFTIHPEEAEPPAELVTLADQIDKDGGAALALYKEPVGGHWQIFALLPRDKVQPTPYQRDLSKAHAERLLKVIKKIDRFGRPGGRRPHRRSLLDPERQPSALRPREAQDAVRSRHRRPRGRGGVPDSGAQHREGAQPQGKIARGDPHVPRPRRTRRQARRGSVRVPVRGTALHHPGVDLRDEPAFRGRRLRADPAPRRSVPRQAAEERL